MAYYSDNWTDKELEALEKRIADVFKEAEKDLDKEVKEYFAKFKLRDKEMKALVDAGEMTEAEYQRWRMTQIGRGQRFEALRDKVAERYTRANEVANAYVNDLTPSIYSLNRNYEAYTIEKAVGSCDFTMWDESTVRRLLVEQPDLMPYYPPSRALNRGIDLEYGKSQITKHVTSGILRGLAPGKIANELMSGITGMNRDSAVRAARTGVTTAQNAGRLDSYIAAENMGIQIKRRWVCTKDARTRFSHGMADGQIVVGTKQPFNVGGYKMMFPGDRSLGAPGHEIYNCRCTTRTVEKDGIEAEPRKMRVKNPETGKEELVNEMTYSEWKNWKLGLENSENGATIKTEMFKKPIDPRVRKGFKFISKKQYDDMTAEVRKLGAVILRGTPWVVKHLEDSGATASNLGTILMFMEDVCVSEVLEETHHFMQTINGMNADKIEPLKTYLNEIDAKKYILSYKGKYKVPRNEREAIQEELEKYEKLLAEYEEGEK